MDLSSNLVLPARLYSGGMQKKCTATLARMCFSNTYSILFELTASRVENKTLGCHVQSLKHIWETRELCSLCGIKVIESLRLLQFEYNIF